MDRDRVLGATRRRVTVGLLVLLTAVGCASTSSNGAGSGSTSSPPSTAGTTRPLTWSATITREWEVSPGFRQGIARVRDGWIFSTNWALYRTDEAGTIVQRNDAAIPTDLAAQGYDHIGDVDVAGDVLWAPLERADKTSGGQRMARYDLATLGYLGSEVVAQHHNSLVAVDGDVVYSTDYFDDDEVVRYRWTGSSLSPLAPLRMSRTVDHIQGADVADGALWLSTDDDHNGVYRVDLDTGATSDLGTMGHIAGEGEGIDATDLPGGLLHALVIDEKFAPVYVVDLAVASRGG